MEFIQPMNMRRDYFRGNEKRTGMQGQIIFQNDHYSIYYNHLEDEMYGKPDAYVVSSRHIISAQRVTEEISVAT